MCDHEDVSLLELLKLPSKGSDMQSSMVSMR